MSTRSNIAMVNPDGKTAQRIYCHWDGYPSWNGRILLNHYKDEKKIKKLINLGNISSLAPEIGSKHDFDDRDEWVSAYHRDRDEKWNEVKPQTVKLNPRNGWEAHCQQEYLYLWKNGQWYYSDHGAPMVRLTKRVVTKEY